MGGDWRIAAGPQRVEDEARMDRFSADPRDVDGPTADDLMTDEEIAAYNRRFAQEWNARKRREELP